MIPTSQSKRMQSFRGMLLQFSKWFVGNLDLCQQLDTLCKKSLEFTAVIPDSDYDVDPASTKPSGQISNGILMGAMVTMGVTLVVLLFFLWYYFLCKNDWVKQPYTKMEQQLLQERAMKISSNIHIRRRTKITNVRLRTFREEQEALVKKSWNAMKSNAVEPGLKFFLRSVGNLDLCRQQLDTLCKKSLGFTAVIPDSDCDVDLASTQPLGRISNGILIGTMVTMGVTLVVLLFFLWYCFLCKNDKAKQPYTKMEQQLLQETGEHTTAGK